MTKIILAGIICLLSALSPCTPAAPPAPSVPPLPTTPAVSHDVSVLFAAYEGAAINLYSSHLDGSNRKLLLSQETKLTNARPGDVIIARVSPDAHRIAYKLPGFGNVNGPAPLFVMDADGENKKQIIGTVADFRWGTDSDTILYALPMPPPGPNEELSFDPDGFEWHRLSLQTSKDETIGLRSQKLHKFGAWLGKDQAVFVSYRLASPLLYILDFATRATTPFELPIGLGYPELSTSSTGGRIVIAGANTTGPCVFYEGDTDHKKVKRLFGVNGQCEGVAWNGKDQFFYGAWLNISEPEKVKLGYNSLGSIYEYDFRTRTNKPVLLSDGKEFYRFEGVVPGRALIVSNEVNGPSPHYILEARDLNGSHPVTLFASNKEVLFLGYLP